MLQAGSSNRTLAIKPTGKSVKVPAVPSVKTLKVSKPWVKANKEIIESIGWSDRHNFIYGLSRVMSTEPPDQVECGVVT